MIDVDTLRRHEAPQQERPPPAMRVAGPRHHRLVQMAAMLDRAPQVQRLHATAAVLQRARVRLAMQMQRGVRVNDDNALEREADAMGARALAGGTGGGATPAPAAKAPDTGVVQRQWIKLPGKMTYWRGRRPPGAGDEPPLGYRRIAKPLAPFDANAGEPPRIGGGGGFLRARPAHMTALARAPDGSFGPAAHLGAAKGYRAPIPGSHNSGPNGQSVAVHDAAGQPVRLRQTGQYGGLAIFGDAPALAEAHDMPGGAGATGPSAAALSSSLTTGPSATAAASSLAAPSFARMASRESAEADLSFSHIAAFANKRQNWSPSQQGAMGKMSALEAVQGAHVPATGAYHWLHLVAFSMGGLDKTQPNVPENLIAGTAESNMIHRVAETAAKKLCAENPGITLKLTATPRARISEQLHVFRHLDYKIALGSRHWEMTLNLLDHKAGHHGDFAFVYADMAHALGIAPSGSVDAEDAALADADTDAAAPAAAGLAHSTGRRRKGAAAWNEARRKKAHAMRPPSAAGKKGANGAGGRGGAAGRGKAGGNKR